MKTILLAAAFVLALWSNTHAQSVRQIETQINQMIESENDLKQDLAEAGIEAVAALALPEAEGGIAVGTIERWGNFCKDFMETRHKLEIPNLWAKYQEMVTIHKNILNEIALLRAYATKREANRFMNMPTVRKWLGEEAEIEQRAHSCGRRTKPKPTPGFVYCPPPTRSWFGPGGEQEMTRQTQVYGDCQRQNMLSRGMGACGNGVRC